MTALNCEFVRDVYPDVLNGKADAALAQNVRAHVASCDECRAEVALLNAIHAQSVSVPAGLHERVLRATAQPQVRRRFSRSDIAMAATLAAALIGGSILLETRGPTQRPAAENSQAEDFGFVGVEDAMMSGKTSLNDLSIEQLEQLLGEIES